MKRLIFPLLMICSILGYSQVPQDALRLSRYMYDGTSRFSAMGGAFTALGGDLSVASLNPAGIGLYRSNEFSVSLGGNFNNSATDYLDGHTLTAQYISYLPNIGFAYSRPTFSSLKGEEGAKSISFAFGYNQLANFNSSFSLSGVNNKNSFLDPIVSSLNDGADPASYLLFTESNVVFLQNNSYTNDYINNANTYYSKQNNIVNEEGHIGEFYFTTAFNYNDKLFLGGGINFKNVYYNRYFYFNEIPDIQNFALNSFKYLDALTTRGLGIDFRIGAIYAPIYWMKFGFSLQTPTVYTLTDTYSEQLTSSVNYTTGKEITTANSEPFIPDYEIVTPYRLNFGTSFMINRMALISVDYEFVDYSLARMNSQKYSFGDENALIGEQYKIGNNIRAGIEVMIGAFALRAGGFYYSSPYVSSSINSDNNWYGASSGLGLRFGQSFLDFSYSYKVDKYKYVPYDNVIGNIDSNSSIFKFTFGYKY